MGFRLSAFGKAGRRGFDFREAAQETDAMIYSTLLRVRSLFSGSPHRALFGVLAFAFGAQVAGPALALGPHEAVPQPRLGAEAFYRRLPDAQLTLVDAPAVKTKTLGTAWIVVAPDGQSFVHLGAHGGELHLGGVKRVLRLRTQTGPVYRAAFSPGMRHLGLITEEGEVSVFALPSGALEWTATRPHVFGEAELAFDGDDALDFELGCQLMRVRPGAGATAQPASPRFCDEARAGNTHPSFHHGEDGSRWIALPRNDFVFIGERQGFLSLHALDPRTGTDRTALAASAEDPLLDVVLSPAGDRACYARRDLLLRCLPLPGADSPAGATEELLVPGVAGRSLAFDATSTHLLASVGAGGPASDLFSFDLRARTATLLGHFVFERAAFLDGDARVLAWVESGPGSLHVLAPAASERFELFANQELGQVAAVPGHPDRFAVGKERGGTADMLLVELPSRSPGAPAAAAAAQTSGAAGR